RGYQVAPGKYTVTLEHKGEKATTTVEILPDPRVGFAAADWAAQQAMLERITAHIHDIHSAVNDMRKIKAQLASLSENLKGMAGAEGILGQGKALTEKINLWESKLIEPRTRNGQDVINWPSGLNVEFFSLRSALDAQDPRITQGLRDRLADLEAEWARYRTAMTEILSQDIPAFNALYKSGNIPVLRTE
ncbi:MAG: glycosyl hydrolase, partial [Saprospiraceae bacterium]